MSRPILSLKRKTTSQPPSFPPAPVPAVTPAGPSDNPPQTKAQRKHQAWLARQEQARLEKLARKAENKQKSERERQEFEEQVVQSRTFLATLGLKAPMAVGSGKELLARFRQEGFSHKASKRAIREWVTSREYLETVLAASVRFNLDGSVASEVSELEKKYTISKLKKLDARSI
ncbi:ProQ/FINO family protein [Shewanella khirikhana]|uniref:Fertility inhibition protein n=1 Tax=Shewanella khirikhana TaxID=1965282 RepID=A0ABM7DXR2_9GAMM|nr:ProQ/FINO family protein [Shewanella khirikhana]AZQ13314.1 Fertility inhibition protein [Shewanella khirikhana]